MIPEGIRYQRGIAVGGVIGRNIFNILAILGLGSLVAPTSIPVAPAALNFDIPVMVAVALACVPIFIRDYQIYRWEGTLFFA